MPMNNKFDLADIQAFAAVAELQSFRAAAESIHLSQPAFSRRIDKLEEALGVRLLDRTTRRVTLTAVGRDFARKTRVWLDDLDGMLMGLGDVAARRMGEVTIACVPSAVYYFLPQVVKRYHERFPKIRVKVHDASANEVLVAVAQGDADFGLNFIGSQEAEIEFKPVLAERFVAACRRDHVLARRKKVSWAELGQHDQNISPEEASRLLGEDVARKVRETTLAIYEAGRAYAASRGIIVADTKFEFGFIDGKLHLIDEVLTPDSSRFWPADQYQPGQGQPSFDKQYLRDWLEKQPWNKQPPPPALPEEIIKATANRYQEAYDILTK